MGAILGVFGNTFQDSDSLLMGLLVFLAAGTLAFSVMAFARVRGSAANPRGPSREIGRAC